MPLDTLHPSKGPGFQPLDADLTALSAISLSRLLATPPDTSSEDWNSITTAGHHNKLMRGNQANGPGDLDYYFVEVRTYGAGGELVQIGMPYYLGGVAQNVYIVRTRYLGAWSPWRRVKAMEDKPAFMARSNYANNAGITGTQIWTDVLYNIGNAYNTSNGRFTAPVAGRYQWSSCALSRGGGILSTSLRMNGSTVVIDEASRAGTNYVSANLMATLNMAAGDWLDLYSNHDNYGGIYCWMSCTLL